jgi:hypothetical protein
MHKGFWTVLSCVLLLAAPARAAPTDPPGGTPHAAGRHGGVPRPGHHPGGFPTGRPMPGGGHFAAGPHATAPHPGGFHSVRPMPGGAIPGAGPHPGGFHAGGPIPGGGHFAAGPHVTAPYPGFHPVTPMPGARFSGREQPPEAPLPGRLGASGPVPGGHFPSPPAGRLVHPAPPAGTRHFDVTRWRSGHWWHGQHGGRIGWWWIVGPAFYWYSSVTAPYPEPPVSMTDYWYWCDAYQRYYPYVTDCPSGWRAVLPQ